jgi:hypothetical protein
MLRVGWIMLAVLALLLSARRIALAADTAKPPVPVLIELFTSEGCSSCPPADDLLARLDGQPIPGVRAIVLSEHVTYWNQDGWHDPFSLDAITDRQREYGSRFNLNDVYTPQAVVDGAAQVVGSNGEKLGNAILQAAAAPKADLAIASAQWSGGAMQFVLHGSVNPDANVFAALAEDSEQINVLRGENGGHTLHHVAVVRTIEKLGKASADAGGPLGGKTLSVRLPASKEVKDSGSLRLVVFLANRHNGHVVAIAEQTVPRS